MSLALATALAGAATGVVRDQCGPFTDVSPALCPYVLEMYYLGITAGTSPTTFSPDAVMTRGQAAVFVSKGVNQALARSSRRAALGQWWNGAQSGWRVGLGVTPLTQDFLTDVACDGTDVWAAGRSDGVFRVRASDGKLLETRPIGDNPGRLLIAMGRVFVSTGFETNASDLLMIDPSQAVAPPTTIAEGLSEISDLAFDGSRIWASTTDGKILVITPSATSPWPVETHVSGAEGLSSILYDGRNVWASSLDGELFRLDSSGAVIQTVSAGDSPVSMAFDGANLWVPNAATVDIVRASDGEVIRSFLGFGRPAAAAFDGERVLILTRSGTSPESWQGLRLFRAADAELLAMEDHDLGRFAVASDGLSFWVATVPGRLARY